MIVHHEMFPGKRQGVSIVPSTTPNLTTFVLPGGVTGATSFTHDGKNSWTYTHMHPTAETPWKVKKVGGTYVVEVGDGDSTVVIYLDAAAAEQFMNAAAELQTMIMTTDTEVTA